MKLIEDNDMVDVMYSKKNNKIEVNGVLLYVRKANFKWWIDVLDKNKNELTLKEYNKPESVNNIAHKYGVNFVFDKYFNK